MFCALNCGYALFKQLNVLHFEKETVYVKVPLDWFHLNDCTKDSLFTEVKVG